jgi:hypothetical protein
MLCRTPPTHTGIGSIPDFLWSGVKLPVWLPTLLSTITCATNVQMAHARPFWTSTLQDLSNGIKKHPNVKCFYPCNRSLTFQESRRTPKSHFRECEWWPHTSLKWGCDKFQSYMWLGQRSFNSVKEWARCEVFGVKGFNILWWVNVKNRILSLRFLIVASLSLEYKEIL